MIRHALTRLLDAIPSLDAASFAGPPVGPFPIAHTHDADLDANGEWS
jgi:hypothetical protein